MPFCLPHARCYGFRMTEFARSDVPVSRSVLEPPLYERLAAVLAGEIARGEVGQGTRLYESHVATRFGTSRAPAREALSRLAAQGLVAPADGRARGFTVISGGAVLPAPVPADLDMAIRPAWEQIYDEIEESIASRIAFGSWRVNETILGARFGVSRTVAREVLGRLQSRGLVTSVGKRWVAPELTPQRLKEFYEMRAILECAALRHIDNDVSHARLCRMYASLEAAIADTPDGATLDALEVELHVELLQTCPNVMLRSAMRQYQVLLLAHRFFYRLTARLFDEEPFLREHLAILGALLDRDPGRAADLLGAHLRASEHRASIRVERIRSIVIHAPIDYLEPVRT